ncbi:hypothetical protein [Nocardia gipuzkoensis]|uniref:hypothetical protein n=1 Tax=Nocardia gipuzkoensis TaxID=2749991 RepID=UPI002454EBFD|nr:hypothetical protein [Nocardia gipuzkoensis]
MRIEDYALDAFDLYAADQPLLARFPGLAAPAPDADVRPNLARVGDPGHRCEEGHQELEERATVMANAFLVVALHRYRRAYRELAGRGLSRGCHRDRPTSPAQRSAGAKSSKVSDERRQMPSSSWYSKWTCQAIEPSERRQGARE